MSAALDLHLSDEQRELYDRTWALAADVFKPISDAGRPGRVNRPLVKALAEYGLLPRLFADGELPAAVRGGLHAKGPHAR